jgi:hypothetical protein
VYVNVQLDEADPDVASVQLAPVENVPAPVEDRFTVPAGGAGATLVSVTVTVQDVDEPASSEVGAQTIAVVVDRSATFMFASPELDAKLTAPELPPP